MSYTSEHVFILDKTAFLFPLYIRGLKSYDISIIDLQQVGR